MELNVGYYLDRKHEALVLKDPNHLIIEPTQWNLSLISWLHHRQTEFPLRQHLGAGMMVLSHIMLVSQHLCICFFLFLSLSSSHEHCWQTSGPRGRKIKRETKKANTKMLRYQHDMRDQRRTNTVPADTYLVANSDKMAHMVLIWHLFVCLLADFKSTLFLKTGATNIYAIPMSSAMKLHLKCFNEFWV